MAVFPVIIDSLPAYLTSGSKPASLLQTPFGTGTMLSVLRARVLTVTKEATVILPDFDPGEDYRQTIGELGGHVTDVVTAAQLRTLLGEHEPSDWLLMINPRHFPSDGFHLEQLLEDVDHSRSAKHLISLQTSADGAREYVQLDEQRRVRKIQRYYEGVTWLRASGVSCSLIPMAAVRHVGLASFFCLSALRRDVATIGIPSRDVSPDKNTIDVHDERGLLAVIEESILEVTTQEPRAPYQAWHDGVHVGPECEIDPTAQICGPVILQKGVTVAAGATVVGPALLGAGSKVGRGAVLAQGMLTRGSVVPDDARSCHRVVNGNASDRALSISMETVNTPEYNTGQTIIGSAAARVTDLRGQDRHSVYSLVKRVIESVVAFLGLIALSPLMLLTAAIIKVSSPGSVLYGDNREGQDGRIFRCWKFRTMVVGAHDQQRALMNKNKVDGPQFKLDDDPRVTSIGRWLRLTNIDELPQLINVAIGQMSLIGPRPSPFRENQICVPWRQARLSVRPGITGLWQVCRHERQAGDFHQWIYYDMLYVRHMSFWLDIKILLATLLTAGGRWSVSLGAMIPESNFDDQSETSAITSWSPTLYPQRDEATQGDKSLASGMA
jgi:lipopolysaccharide/colanic/teichoic acid biosynthesis glycosyltransferase